MAHPPEKRMKLRAAYIGGLPLEQAAGNAGVPYPTARRWFQDAKTEGDDWDKFRAASLIVAGGGIEQAMGRIVAAGLTRCEALTERLATEENIFEAAKALASLGDTVSKLKAASKGMMPEADRLGVAMDVVKDLSEFIRAEHPRHMQAFAEILEGFGARLAKSKG